jgi:hypothetical protein
LKSTAFVAVLSDELNVTDGDVGDGMMEEPDGTESARFWLDTPETASESAESGEFPVALSVSVWPCAFV